MTKDYVTDIEKLHDFYLFGGETDFVTKTIAKIYEIVGSIQTGNDDVVFVVNNNHSFDDVVPMIIDIFTENDIQIVKIRKFSSRVELEVVFDGISSRLFIYTNIDIKSKLTGTYCNFVINHDVDNFHFY
jgi:hypothetical protein